MPISYTVSQTDCFVNCFPLYSLKNHSIYIKKACLCFFVRNCILTLWLRQNVFDSSFIDRLNLVFFSYKYCCWVALKKWHFIHVWMSAGKISWRQIAESKGKLMPLWFGDTAKLPSKEVVPIYILTTKAWDCASHSFKQNVCFTG